MAQLLEIWHTISHWLVPLLFGLHFVIMGATIFWILMTKAEPQSAVAWCLIVILVPYIGALLFVLFGYQHVHRPLRRKRLQRERYRQGMHGSGLSAKSRRDRHTANLAEGEDETAFLNEEPLRSLQHLADRVDAFPLTFNNTVDFYHEGCDAFAAKIEALRSARHHIHLEYYIVEPDDLGLEILQILTEKARHGVQVRLLYDAMGSSHLKRKHLEPLWRAGGKTSVFLPLNPLRRRIQVNMRNHRKILVVDGVVGFTGGMNIGLDYVSKSPEFPYWRDTHLRLRGPAVSHLQRVFCEDWDFAAHEDLRDGDGAVAGASYFIAEAEPADGSTSVRHPVQVIDSGPDRDLKGIREIYFAAILQARKRVWITSPYFVPDAGILDALRLAAYLGVDVRFLGQFQPDQRIPQYAAQYYWTGMLTCGVKIYQYTRGMVHAKVMLIDDCWASVGSANLDNRSLHLNFELNCLFYSKEAVAELAAAFEKDLEYAIRLDARVYGRRPFANRLLENACRLLSPIL